MSTCKIEIILGCMFSGKTTELIRRTSKYDAIGKNVLIINSGYDNRCDLQSIKSHSNETRKAYKCYKLSELNNHKLFSNADVIAIDEAQFFHDLYDFVLYCEKNDKIVIISGLDGDSDRKPFGQILECIPLCDDVVKLKALDMISLDGTDAIFSKRIVKNNSQICIGNENEYKAVNRYNYCIS
jgi:thymidine kinase